MKYLRQFIRFIIRWAFEQEFQEMKDEYYTTLKQHRHKVEEHAKIWLEGVQAWDYDPRGCSKVILCLKVNGRDYVRIFDFNKKMTMRDVRELADEFKHRFNMADMRFDAPLSYLAPDHWYGARTRPDHVDKRF